MTGDDVELRSSDDDIPGGAGDSSDAVDAVDAGALEPDHYAPDGQRAPGASRRNNPRGRWSGQDASARRIGR
ncbi:MAG: hypothetical protein ACK5MR_13265 [Cumulibacter sp.]